MRGKRFLTLQGVLCPLGLKLMHVTYLLFPELPLPLLLPLLVLIDPAWLRLLGWKGMRRLGDPHCQGQLSPYPSSRR